MAKQQGLSFVLALLGGMRTSCLALFAAHALGAAGFQTLIRHMEIVALYSRFMAVTTSDQPGSDFTIPACAQLLVYLAG